MQKPKPLFNNVMISLFDYFFLFFKQLYDSTLKKLSIVLHLVMNTELTFLPTQQHDDLIFIFAFFMTNSITKFNYNIWKQFFRLLFINSSKVISCGFNQQIIFCSWTVGYSPNESGTRCILEKVQTRCLRKNHHLIQI